MRERAPVLSKMQERAQLMYAEEHNIEDSKQVTLRMLEESAEGLQGWAYKGMDMGSRGPIGQALSKVLKKPENHAIAQVFKYIPWQLQEKFRMSWGVHKNFEFLKEAKRTRRGRSSARGRPAYG